MTSSSMVRTDRKRRRAGTPCSPPGFQAAATTRVRQAIAAILSITTLVNNPTTIYAMTASGADKPETRGAPPLLQGGKSSLATHNGNNNTTTTIPNCQRIRNALSKEFPELETETLYSDAYLESIAAVPGRPLEYAIHHSVKRALEWRRSHKVDDLLQAFETVHPSNSSSEDEHRVSMRGKWFVPTNGDKDNGSLSRELVEVCRSGAFCVLDEPVAMERLVEEATNGKNPAIPRRQRLVVYADTSKLNWWKTGVTAGLQYHVLVLEDAFARIRRENQDHHHQYPIHKDNKDSDSNTNTTTLAQPWLEESLLLCVDTTAPPWLPPPLGALRGMVRLLQKAYPDRIHQIYVGPVSPWLRALWGRVRPWIKPKIRNKITLLGEAPWELLNRWRSNSTTTNTTVSYDEC